MSEKSSLQKTIYELLKKFKNKSSFQDTISKIPYMRNRLLKRWFQKKIKKWKIVSRRYDFHKKKKEKEKEKKEVRSEKSSLKETISIQKNIYVRNSHLKKNT